MDKRKQVLMRALQDENEDIRALAAEALERLEIRGKVSFLEKLIESGNKIEKLRAIYAAGNLRGSQVLNLLSMASRDSIEDVRATAIRVLGTIGDKSVLPELVEKLKDPSMVVERVAIDAISNYREPQTLGPLLQMLRSKDAGVVERAIDVIGRTGDKRAEEAMIYFTVKGNLNMRSFAIRALGLMEA